MEQPKNLIDNLENKLLVIYNLLFVWKNYIEIMKLSYESVKQIQQGSLSEGMEDAEDRISEDQKLKEAIEAKKKQYQTGNDQDSSIENFMGKVQQEMADAAQYNAIAGSVKNSDTFVNELGKQTFDQIQKEFDQIKEQINSIYGANATKSPQSGTGDSFFATAATEQSDKPNAITPDNIFVFFGLKFKTVD